MSDLIERSDYACGVLRVLGHPMRLTILCRLCDGECCVGDLANELQIGQSSVSQHLKRLRAFQLVRRRRERTVIFYSLNRPAETWLEALRGACDESETDHRPMRAA